MVYSICSAFTAGLRPSVSFYCLGAYCVFDANVSHDIFFLSEVVSVNVPNGIDACYQNLI